MLIETNNWELEFDLSRNLLDDNLTQKNVDYLNE